MAVNLSMLAGAGAQFFDNNGDPLTGGKLYTYAAGTTTPLAAYTTSAGNVAHANPIILDAAGRTPSGGEIWLTDAVDYKFVLATGTDVVLGTFDNVAGNGSGIFASLASSSGSSLVGFLQSGAGAVARTVQSKLREVVSVKDFGAVGDGVANDTAAIQAAINYGIAANAKVIIPSGDYLVDMVQVKDAVYDFTLHCENAFLIGTATTARLGVIDVVNCVDFHMTGSWHFISNDNANYDAGLYIRAQAGTSQATSRVNVYNPTFRNFKVGMAVGSYNIDFQCSEINVFGANFFKCPIAVYNGGSQTGTSYNGCNLVSEINNAFVGSVCRAIWIEGGFVTVVGGSVVNAESTTGQTILFNPASSALYGNPYGIVRIAGSHIETASQMAVIANNRSLSAPTSDMSNLTITAAGGFVSSGIATQDFIFIGDATFAGYVQVTDCNFYSNAPRTQYNVSSASSLAKIKTDKASFNKNFMGWLNGVSGGKLLHDQELIVDAYGINATLPSGESVLKFLNAGASTLRYGAYYSTSTGLFTVPGGGLKYLNVRAFILGGSTPTGDIYVKLNGNIVRFGRYSSGIGEIDATLQNLSAGDTVGVYINQGSGNAFDNGVYQSLKIVASTQ
jgi:hypothetical protein